MEYLQTVVATIGVLGALSFVVAYLKTDVTKKTVTQLKELAEALEMRVNALESEREELVERLAHLEEENQILRSLLDGAKNNNDLHEKIDQNHMELLKIIEATFSRIELLISAR